MKELLSEEVRGARQLFHGDLAGEGALKHGIPKSRILDFSTNVNPIGPPASVLDSIRKNLERISKYPPHEPAELREGLARHSGASGEEIVLGNGSNELIYLLARTFLGRGDESVIVEPTFTEHSKAAGMQGSGVRPVQLKEDRNFKLKEDEVLEKISKDTKLAILCSPNNPTGRMVPPRILEHVVEACEDCGTLVVADEVFHEYCDNPQKYNTAEMESDNLISLRSLTKFYGLAGLRIGYLVAPEPLAKVLRGVQVRWNVNVLAQLAAKEALEDSEFASRTKELTKEGKNFLRGHLEEFGGLRVHPSDANFFLVSLSETGLDSPQLVEKLLHRGIAIRDCSDFKFLDENYVRIGVRPIEDCRKLVEAMEDIGPSGALDDP